MKYRLVIKRNGKSEIYHSDSFFHILRKYENEKIDSKVVIDFEICNNGQWDIINKPTDYLQLSREQFVNKNYELFKKFLHEDFKI